VPSPARKSSLIGRTLLRNTIFASVASIIGSIGFQGIAKVNSATFSGFITGLLGSFIFFWGLRTPAALLELYITKRHSRRWIFWPHGLAMVTAVIAISGNESNPGQSPMFRHVLSIQAATVALLYYLICALALLIPVGIAILIINVMTNRTGRDSASTAPKPALVSSGQAISKLNIRSHITRLYRTPSRDAAVLAVSIITAIASLVQGFDIHNVGKTILAFAAGTAGLYALSRLPNVRQDSTTTSQHVRAAGKHGKSPSSPTDAQSDL
jgi:hypothetical protein